MSIAQLIDKKRLVTFFRFVAKFKANNLVVELLFRIFKKSYVSFTLEKNNVNTIFSLWYFHTF